MVVFDVNPQDDRYTTARNAWMGTGYAKGGAYTRSNVPWDHAEQGTAALSSAQRSRNEAFTRASKQSVSACADVGGKQTFVCRARAIGNELK